MFPAGIQVTLVSDDVFIIIPLPEDLLFESRHLTTAETHRGLEGFYNISQHWQSRPRSFILDQDHMHVIGHEDVFVQDYPGESSG